MMANISALRRECPQAVILTYHVAEGSSAGEIPVANGTGAVHLDGAVAWARMGMVIRL